jgi:ribokinase
MRIAVGETHGKGKKEISALRGPDNDFVTREGKSVTSVPRITVVGSYAAGLTMNVPHLPAPGETQLGSGYRVEHGGKGSNQAVGCARLGARVQFVARIGMDAFGDMALGLYQQEGVDTACVTRTSQCPTGIGFVIVESATGRNLISLDPGANCRLSPRDIFHSRQALASADVVLTQLEIPVPAAAAALESAHSHGALTILNPAPAQTLPRDVLRLAHVLTPNESEARSLADIAEGTLASEEDIARELMNRGAARVVITLGDKGALIATHENVVRVPAIPVQAVDTTGAGDAFNAGLAVALACGADLRDAVSFAVLTGGLAVTKPGVVPSLATLDDVLRFYDQSRRPVPEWLRTRMRAETGEARDAGQLAT